MNVVSPCGYSDSPFHLVEHNWSGSIAGGLADPYPDRPASIAPRPCRTASRRRARAITKPSSSRRTDSVGKRRVRAARAVGEVRGPLSCDRAAHIGPWRPTGDESSARPV
jgi:hypothetical protein